MNKIDNKISMRTRFTFMFILFILLPILILNFVLAILQIQRVSTQYITSNKYALSDVPLSLKNDFDFAFNYSNVVYNDYDINMFLNTNFKSPKDFYDKYSSYSINKIFDFYANQSQNIGAPEIFSNNPTMTGETANLKKIDNDVKKKAWYVDFIKSGKDVFLYVDKETRYASVIRKLNLNTSAPYENFVRIIIDLDYVEENFLNTKIPCSAYLFGDGSLPLYVWDCGFKPLNDVSHYGLLQEDTSSDELSLVYSYNIDYYGDLRVVIVIDKPFPLDKDIIMITAISLCVTLLASFLFMRSMQKNYIQRIEGLVSNIDINEFINPDDKTEKSKKKPKIHNELTIVEETMENMSKQVHALIKEAYTLEMEKNQAEIRRKQSELNSLLSQINPHYLFNVLNAIRLKCIIKGEKETAKIILYVSKIFRQSITWNEDVITLNEEINFIKEYLAIEKYRFEDKLNYEINVKEELLSCEIPKMALQPFVENACVHGVQNTISQGNITIDVDDVDENSYSFTITNPVVDFSDEIKNQIIGYSKGDFDVDTKSVGLKNTFARLRHYYDDFGFDIVKNDDTVSFKLILPKHAIHHENQN
ncbi:MAG: histidine kinase [Clostridia bacterium]